MTPARRARLVALHRWAGLFGGWMLFAVFLWGTISVYDTEITDWMEPELHAGAADPRAGAAIAEHLLRTHAHGAAWWRIELPGPRSALLHLSWCGGAAPCGTLAVDATTGRPVRATRGGDLFYALHYGLMLGTPGAIVVGFAGLVALALIASGVLIHLRRLVPDLVLLRLDGAAVRAWRDAHVLLGVATLPFLVTFTYSGVLVFAFATLPSPIDARYRTGSAGFFADLDRTVPVGLARPGRGTTVADAVATARAAPGMGGVDRVFVTAPDQPHGRRIELTEPDGATLSLRRSAVVIDGETGAIVARTPPAAGAPVETARLLWGIHFARFGGPGLRALYAASGAIGTASIAAALALFGARRRRRPTGAGLPIADRASLAATLGLLDACLAPFWANRLLPPGLGWRAGGETGALLLCWLGGCAISLLVRRPLPILLAAGAGLGLALPALDLATASVAWLPVVHGAVDGTIASFGFVSAIVLVMVRQGNRSP